MLVKVEVLEVRSVVPVFSFPTDVGEEGLCCWVVGVFWGVWVVGVVCGGGVDTGVLVGVVLGVGEGVGVGDGVVVVLGGGGVELGGGVETRKRSKKWSAFAREN